MFMLILNCIHLLSLLLDHQSELNNRSNSYKAFKSSNLEYVSKGARLIPVNLHETRTLHAK